MSMQERSATERVQEGRERWVARGISTQPLVVARAEGARIWDADGREFLVPFAISDEDLARGVDILQECLGR